VDLTERDIRQRELLPPKRLASLHVTVIGVGAIGRQLSLQLAAIGVGKLHLVDFDDVGVENLAVQGFLEDDIDKRKVDAVGDLCRLTNSQIEIVKEYGRFNRSTPVGDIVFSCVDTMRVRSFIFEQTKERTKLFIDGRMLGEVMRILSVRCEVPEDVEYYETKTLDADGDIIPGRCTNRSTLYCSNMAAAWMVLRFTQWLRDQPLKRDISLGLQIGQVLDVEADLAAAEAEEAERSVS